MLFNILISDSPWHVMGVLFALNQRGCQKPPRGRRQRGWEERITTPRADLFHKGLLSYLWRSPRPPLQLSDTQLCCQTSILKLDWGALCLWRRRKRLQCLSARPALRWGFISPSVVPRSSLAQPVPLRHTDYVHSSGILSPYCSGPSERRREPLDALR